MPTHTTLKRTIATTALAATLTIPTAAYACHTPPTHSTWRHVPHAIRAQFRTDGQPLKGRCRIQYGDTTYIQCTYHGITTTYTS